MSHDYRLAHDERCQIKALLSSGDSQRTIVRELGPDSVHDQPGDCPQQRSARLPPQAGSGQGRESMPRGFGGSPQVYRIPHVAQDARLGSGTPSDQSLWQK